MDRQMDGKGDEWPGSKWAEDTSVLTNDLVRIYAHLNTGAHDLAQFTDKADATMGYLFEFPIDKIHCDVITKDGEMFTTTLEVRYDHAALTAERNGEMITFLVVDTQDGKSMRLNIIETMLKGCLSFDGDKLRNNGIGSTGDDVTHLFNKLIRARCAIASEIKGSSTLNHKALKQLASNDSIEYRTLYSPISDYTPIFKAIVATNTIPEFSAEAKASADISTLFRRMIIVNFPMKIKTTNWIYAMLGLLVDSFPEAADKTKPLSAHDDLQTPSTSARNSASATLTLWSTLSPSASTWTLHRSKAG
ncbi:uncharacterized protein BJ171DRAFT_603355 [Polychytrium aggregatum]|uniref:uncharacterized protein n=1 Tax=Polychytrium aggregatum TaxID=110093 RepID=UPI0022FE7CA1|nr:uncharacterized protein BJ171DRAFT_603355 [Polychytrium aggregatum]KAI9193453.1 hypothetical protein BJ171DRAFT_603355 [Polychytrium aggregatum]